MIDFDLEAPNLSFAHPIDDVSEIKTYRVLDYIYQRYLTPDKNGTAGPTLEERISIHSSWTFRLSQNLTGSGIHKVGPPRQTDRQLTYCML